MTKLEQRISVVETNIDNITSRMERFIQYMEKYTEKRDKSFEVMQDLLAVLKNGQDNFREYQVECNEERRVFRTNQEDMKNSQTAQKAWATGVAAAVASVMMCLGYAIDWMKR